MRKILLLTILFCTCIGNAQSIPHTGTDPSGVQDFAPYDWTAPLKFPNDSTKFLRGDWSWSTVGGSVVANPTVGTFPYLSGANTYSDSPLIRVNSNTVGSPASVDLNINAATGQTLRLQRGGSNVLAIDNQGVEISQKLNQVAGFGTAGNFGVAVIAAFKNLDGHNEATRTDSVFTAGGGLGPGLGGTYEFSYSYITHTVQAGASVQATITYVDVNGNTQTILSSVLSLATIGQITGNITMRLSGLVQVVSATTAIGSGFYDATFVLKQIN